MNTSGGAPLLAVDGLTVEFATADGWARVVDDVSFTVGRGETVGLLGESGCGKSVTSLAVMGLLPEPAARVVAGTARLDSVDLLSLADAELADRRGNQMAMVFQEPMTSLDPAFTVGQQIASVARRHQHLNRRQARQRAIEMLDVVGIAAPTRRVDDYPHTFSGGMRQRVMIAIALVCEPDLLIADEPTTALDVTVQAQVLDLLASLQRKFGMGILFVSHDMAVISQMCERAVVMYAGQVVEQAVARDLFVHPQHPYTAGLLACLPAEHERERLHAIPGTVPAAGALPGGCRFHPRCTHAVQGRCDVEAPGLFPAARGASARCLRVDELVLEGVR